MSMVTRSWNLRARNLKNPATPWNTRLRELAKEGHFKEGVELYCQMLHLGIAPNAFTFPFALKSCASLSLPSAGAQIHCRVVKSGCEPEPFVQSSLISFYCKCSLPDNARKLFDNNPYSKAFTVCYNSLIAGLTSNSKCKEATNTFYLMRQMGVSCNSVTLLGLLPVCTLPLHLAIGASIHAYTLVSGLGNNISVGNCFLSMYLRCGEVKLARKLFDKMPEKDLITWNSMISGYAQNGFAAEVLNLYNAMGYYGISPDSVTFVGVISSCAHLGAQFIAREVEKRIEACGYGCNQNLNNALINMYARSGNLGKAHAIFDSMPQRNLISWTAIISGYGVHGHGEVAVRLFDEMVDTGIEPDDAAFVCVLSACSHGGLTDKGLAYFESMSRDYSLEPGLQHYACMVDLLGRAGRLEEARNFVLSMPIEPDGAIWGALLGACRIHKNVALAELAFRKVTEFEPMNIGYYSLLANIYLEANNLDGVARIRVMMRERKLRKDPGYSYIEIAGRIYLFFAGDRTHPQTEDLYKILEDLGGLVERLGECKVIDKSVCNKDMMNSMGSHSEKLAVAFGLLHTAPGKELLLIKNLRVCIDCHAFLKAVSHITKRSLIVRDVTRFHHFVEGTCSCKDYW